MKPLFLLIGLMVWAVFGYAQVFVVTKSMVYRCDAARASKNVINLYAIDTINKKAEVIHSLTSKDGVEAIIFPNSKSKMRFESNADFYGITYKVIDPMPSLLKDSIFTGPRHLSLISQYFSLDSRSINQLNGNQLGIDNSLVRASYDLQMFRKQSLVGIGLSLASTAVGLLAYTPNADPQVFSIISITGVIIGQIIWIDAYKHIGRASIGIDEAGRQLKLKIGF